MTMTAAPDRSDCDVPQPLGPAHGLGVRAAEKQGKGDCEPIIGIKSAESNTTFYVEMELKSGADFL